MRTIFLSKILMLAFVLTLTACGGGGGGGGPVGGSTNTGYFVDSAVSGLSYLTSSGIAGVTDATGAFDYAPGDTVTFSVGDVVIGEATGASLLTPVSLVPGATDETDTTVTNIARFLQSLDDDGDPSNGITIDADVAIAAAGQSLDFSSANFDTDASTLVEAMRDAAYGIGDTGTLVDAVTAQAHLLGSLLCEYSGTFEGTYVHTAGPEVGNNGTWSFSIDSDGNITGTANTSDGPFSISGNVSSDGSSVAGNVADGATFTGSIGFDGSVSGTWGNSLYGTSGTYSGSRTQDASSECDGSSSTPVSSEGSIMLSGTDTGVIGTSFTPNSTTVESNGLALHWSTTVDAGGGNTEITHSLLALFGFDGSLLSMTFTREVGNDSYVYEIFCNLGGCDSISNNTTSHTVTFTNTVFPAFALGGAATGSITLNGSLNYASVASELSFTGDPGNVTQGEFGTLTIAGNDTSQFGTTFTPDTAYMQNPDRPAWEIESNGRFMSVWVDINADGTAGAVDFRDIGSNLNEPMYVYQLNCVIPGQSECTTLADNVVIDLGAKTVTFNNVSLPTYGAYNETGPVTLNGTLTYTGTLVFP